MGSPVNLGDAIAIFTQIYNAYDTYRSVPDALKQALEKLKDVEKECKALNEILASSRRPEHSSWSNTDSFIADLKKARDYIQQFKPLLGGDDEVQFLTKVRHTIKAKFNESTIKDHVATIERHRENMKSFKETVLIQAANDNIGLSIISIKLQLGYRPDLEPQEQRLIADDTSSRSSDRISMLSKARESLRLAGQLESSPIGQDQSRLTPIIEASSPPTESPMIPPSDDLRHTVASFIEARKLYDPRKLEDSRMQDLEYIAKLPRQWYKQQQQIRKDLEAEKENSPLATPTSVLKTQKSSVQPTSPPQSLPIRSQYASDSHSISPSWAEAFNGIRYPTSLNGRSSLGTQILPNPAVDMDESIETEYSAETLSDADDEHRDVLEGVIVIEPWEGRGRECRLSFVRSEGSLCITASTVKQYEPASRPVLSGITPSSLLGLNYSATGVTPQTTTVPLVFKHAIGNGMSSFPKILHPVAEIGEARYSGYPYTIEFYEHQYFLADDYPRLPPAMKGLVYAFKSKADRDLTRKHIFGKELLASAGVATIQFDTNSIPKPCSTQAWTLWKTSRPQHREDSTDSTIELTVTIQCSTEKRQTEPNCVCEFVIVKAELEHVKKVKAGKAKELKLQLRPLNRSNPDSDEILISGAVLSSNSTATNISAMSDYSSSPPEHVRPESRRTSFFSRKRTSSIGTALADSCKQEPLVACWARFTEGGQGLSKAKEAFLDALVANIKS